MSYGLNWPEFGTTKGLPDLGVASVWKECTFALYIIFALDSAQINKFPWNLVCML